MRTPSLVVITLAVFGCASPPLRSDVSCTLFIADPAEYQGGELVIHQGSEVTRIKGNAGAAVFYPSTRVHQVTAVTGGARLVMITFINSEVVVQYGAVLSVVLWVPSFALMLFARRFLGPQALGRGLGA